MQENSEILQQMETVVKLYGDQLKLLMQKIDDMTLRDQERHNILKEQSNIIKEEMDLMRVRGEAQDDQMVSFADHLDRLEETTEALMNISNDLQPVVNQQQQAQQTTINRRQGLFR